MMREVGERQRWAWLTAALSGVAAAEICSFHWLWVLLGGAAAIVYQIWVERQIGPNGLGQVMTAVFGRFGKVLALLTLAWMIFVMGWVALLADKAFPMVDGFPSLGWVLLALAAWGSWKGPGACARCSGVLCLFLIVLYGIVGGFSIPDIQTENLKLTGMWTDVVWTLGLFLLPMGVWYMPCKHKKKGSVWAMAIFLPTVAAGLAAAAAGVLSPVLVKEETVPLYTLAQSVSLFGVIERIEPLLSAAMTMGVFSLLSALACGCRALFDLVRPCRWSGPVACAAAAGVMYVAKDMTVELLTGGVWIFWVMIPLITLLYGKMKGMGNGITISGGSDA